MAPRPASCKPQVKTHISEPHISGMQCTTKMHTTHPHADIISSPLPRYTKIRYCDTWTMLKVSKLVIWQNFKSLMFNAAATLSDIYCTEWLWKVELWVRAPGLWVWGFHGDLWVWLKLEAWHQTMLLPRPSAGPEPVAGRVGWQPPGEGDARVHQGMIARLL